MRFEPIRVLGWVVPWLVILLPNTQGTEAVTDSSKVVLKRKALAGTYNGGGRQNVALTLKESGKYVAEWHWYCSPKPDRVMGKWAITNQTVLLCPEKKQGAMAKVLASMESFDVKRYEHSWVLVRSDHNSRAEFKERGLDSYFYFRKIAGPPKDETPGNAAFWRIKS